MLNSFNHRKKIESTCSVCDRWRRISIHSPSTICARRRTSISRNQLSLTPQWRSLSSPWRPLHCDLRIVTIDRQTNKYDSVIFLSILYSQSDERPSSSAMDTDTSTPVVGSGSGETAPAAHDLGILDPEDLYVKYKVCVCCTCLFGNIYFAFL